MKRRTTVRQCGLRPVIGEGIIMSKVESIKGVLKTFFWLSKEEFDTMDHKMLRIAFGIVGFAVAAAFWYFVFSKFAPF